MCAGLGVLAGGSVAVGAAAGGAVVVCRDADGCCCVWAAGDSLVVCGSGVEHAASMNAAVSSSASVVRAMRTVCIVGAPVVWCVRSEF